MHRHLSPLALLAAMSLLGACGSSTETAEITTEDSPSGAAIAADEDTTETESQDDASEVPAVDSATCETWTEGGDELIRFDFVGSAEGLHDYWVRVAEPDGSNDSAFQLYGIDAGDVVSITQEMVGAPADCVVTSLDPWSADEDFEDIDGCSPIEAPHVGRDENFNIGVDITNRGDGPASYVIVVNLIDSSGAFVAQVQANSVDKVDPGATFQATGTTGLFPPDADLTCEIAFNWRQG